MSTQPRSEKVSPWGRYASEDDRDLVTVRLLGVPVRLWCRATEQHDELLREFSLLSFGIDEGATKPDELPARLVTLVRELRTRYGGNGERDDVTRQAALVREDATVDLTYEVPVTVGHAGQALAALLEEVDEYCRSDSYLLTLAPDDSVIAFRHWYLEEFTRQVQGLPPRPWTGPLE
jgi:hypothetical protein